MNDSNSDFYKELSAHHQNLESLFTSAQNFVAFPESWIVVVTDIQGSTLAITAGKYQVVNNVAASCIIAMVNIAQKYNLEIPYVFGGDGATAVIPAKLWPEISQALLALQTRSEAEQQLKLRVGSIPLSELYKQNIQLSVAKIALADNFMQPVFVGNALEVAEKIIKQDKEYQITGSGDLNVLNLSGLQCRWQPVAPPNTKEEVLCLLVSANQASHRELAYTKILQKIEDVYGDYWHRHPISVEKLHLGKNINSFADNRWVTSPRSVQTFVINFYKLIVGNLFVKLGKLNINFQGADTYVNSIAVRTDCLKMDNTLKTIISGTIEQRKKLIQYLDNLEVNGEITYGHHVAKAALLTCFVRDVRNNHIHFIDGAEGGYTLAAKEWKEKLAN